MCFSLLRGCFGRTPDDLGDARDYLVLGHIGLWGAELATAGFNPEQTVILNPLAIIIGVQQQRDP